MPTPREAFTNTVQREGYSGARVRAADFGAAGETLGRAAQGFGQDIGRVAQDIEAIDEQYDTAAVKQADAEDSVKISRIRAEAMTRTGFDAQQGVNDSRAQIEAIRTKRMASLKGSRQQTLYGDVFNQRLAAVEGDLTTHSVKQVDVAKRGASKARSDASVIAAIDSYDNPKMFTANLQTARTEFAEANRGAGAGAIELGQRALTSSAHRQVIEGLVADPENIFKASDRLAMFAKDILPDDEKDLRRMLNPLLEEQQDESRFGQFLAFNQGDKGATPPSDPLADADAPTPSVPRREGAPIKDVFSHIVSGKGGRISSGFGRRGAPTAGASTDHGGVDVPAPEGTPIRPPMSGHVHGKPWFDRKGGYQVRIKHPNGMITGYAHMRAASALREGDEVSSTTIIGGVGSTGHSTGNHLHFTVKDASGKKVDPQKASWKEAALEPPAGASSLPDYSGEKNQLGSLLSKAHEFATANNLSPKEYKRLISQVREHAGINEQVYNERYEEIKERATQAVVDLPGGSDALTSVSQVPGFGAMEGPDQLRFVDLIQANKRRAAEGPGGAVKANGLAYADYRVMAENPDTRSAFMAMEFRNDPNITAAERTRLRTMQVSFNNDNEGKLSPSFDRLYKFVNRYQTQAGFSANLAGRGEGKDKRTQSMLFDRIRPQVEALQKGGRVLNDTELDDLVRRETVTVTRRNAEGIAFNTGPQFKLGGKKAGERDEVNPAVAYNGIPAQTRSAIIVGLRQANKAITVENVVRMYLRGGR